MNVTLVCDDEDVRRRIFAMLLTRGIACARSDVYPLDQAEARLAGDAGKLVILVMPRDPDGALVALHLLENLPKRSGAHVIAIGPIANAKMVIRALRGRVDEYLDEDDLDAEFAAALARITVAEETARDQGRVIAVLGPSGGSGSSTIAANLAASLAKERTAVALLDMKMPTGDLASLMDLAPKHSIADLCVHLEKLDPTLLAVAMAEHPCGVSLLASPPHFDDVAAVTGDAVGRIIDVARASYPYVVADVDHTFGEPQWATLQRADAILLVFRLDYPSLHHVTRTREALRERGVAPDRIRLVVNRYGRTSALPYATAEDVLGAKIPLWVPEDARAVNRASNRGEPVVLGSPWAKVSRCLTQIADTLKTIPTVKPVEHAAARKLEFVAAG